MAEFVTEGKLLSENDSVRPSEKEGVTVGLESERDADWNSVSVSSDTVWESEADCEPLSNIVYVTDRVPMLRLVDVDWLSSYVRVMLRVGEGFVKERRDRDSVSVNVRSDLVTKNVSDSLMLFEGSSEMDGVGGGVMESLTDGVGGGVIVSVTVADTRSDALRVSLSFDRVSLEVANLESELVGSFDLVSDGDTVCMED